MKIFIDSAEITEIEAAAKTGLVDGVTTNPSLVAKSGVSFEELLHRICELVNGPISAEVTALDAKGMIEEGKKLAALNPNIVVKAPLTMEGLIATKELTTNNMNVNVTLCFSTVQAVMAAKAAIAAHRQGKFRQFHISMMTWRGKIDEDAIDAAVKKGKDSNGNAKHT